MNIAEEASLIRQLEEARAIINQRNGEIIHLQREAARYREQRILQTRWLSSCAVSLRILRRRHNEPPPGGLLFIHPLFKCRRGERHQVVMLPVYPCINHICPLLQHVGPLPGILCLVVNRPHALLFMRKRLLYPV
ncbi:Uncharacterised protein [Serratia liquefaciens]|nr:Uncharacterised protein [Serratia liquefaciens]